MNADPRLLALARQLGQLIKAYGREGFADGHAQLELAKAFQDGMNAHEPGSVVIDLPLTGTHSDDRSLPPFKDDPFDLNARNVLRLEIMPFVVDLQRAPGSAGAPVDQAMPAWASARFDGEERLVFETFSKTGENIDSDLIA